jgi:hypothetical protein
MVGNRNVGPALLAVADIQFNFTCNCQPCGKANRTEGDKLGGIRNRFVHFHRDTLAAIAGAVNTR